MTIDRRSMLLGLAATLALGCARPTPPRITPRSADVTGATAQGLGLKVHCVVRNGNSFDLTVQRISVRLTLGGRDLGVTDLQRTIRLPSNVDVPMDIDVRAPWVDLAGLIAVSVFIPHFRDGIIPALKLTLQGLAFFMVLVAMHRNTGQAPYPGAGWSGAGQDAPDLAGTIQNPHLPAR